MKCHNTVGWIRVAALLPSSLSLGWLGILFGWPEFIELRPAISACAVPITLISLGITVALIFSYSPLRYTMRPRHLSGWPPRPSVTAMVMILLAAIVSYDFLHLPRFGVWSISVLVLLVGCIARSLLEHWFKVPSKSGQGEDLYNRGWLLDRLEAHVCDANVQSIALKGGFGTGKTFLCEMLRLRLKDKEAQEARKDRKARKDRVLMVTCRTWAHNEESLTESVINHIMEELHQAGIEVISMLGLSSSYVKRFVDRAPSTFKALTHLLLAAPKDELGQLTRVLRNNSISVVLVLEDLDRNGTEESFTLVHRLLDDFASVQEVTTILAISPDHAPDMVNRVCEIDEAVPTIDPTDLQDRFRTFWDEVLEATPPDVHVEASAGTFLAMLGEKEVPFGITDAFSNLYNALANLAGTPRGLDRAFRGARKVWAQIPGEVNFADVLLLNLLRQAAPDHYAFIERRKNELKLLKFGAFRPVDKKAAERVREELQELVPHTGVRYEDFALILNFMDFPVPASSKELAEAATDTLSTREIVESVFDQSGAYLLSKSCQRASSTEGVDYFERIQTGRLRKSDLPDQKILHLFSKSGGGSLRELGRGLRESSTIRSQLTSLSKIILSSPDQYDPRTLDFLEAFLTDYLGSNPSAHYLDGPDVLYLWLTGVSERSDELQNVEELISGFLKEAAVKNAVVCREIIRKFVRSLNAPSENTWTLVDACTSTVRSLAETSPEAFWKTVTLPGSFSGLLHAINPSIGADNDRSKKVDWTNFDWSFVVLRDGLVNKNEKAIQEFWYFLNRIYGGEEIPGLNIRFGQDTPQKAWKVLIPSTSTREAFEEFFPTVPLPPADSELYRVAAELRESGIDFDANLDDGVTV